MHTNSSLLYWEPGTLCIIHQCDFLNTTLLSNKDLMSDFTVSVYVLHCRNLFSGWILIDRCGKHFGTILNFLRDGCVPLPESSKQMAELLAEAKYYCISELAESCEQALLKKERDAEPICRVPLITSQKEEQLLISSTSKVVWLQNLCDIVVLSLLKHFFWSLAIVCVLVNPWVRQRS